MPAEVAVVIRHAGHNAWTAFEAHLEALPDEAILIYAERGNAVVVTTNKDFIPVARRMGVAPVVYLRCLEVHAVDAMKRALDWLAANKLPDGRVLRVHRSGADHSAAPSALAYPTEEQIRHVRAEYETWWNLVQASPIDVSEPALAEQLGADLAGQLGTVNVMITLPPPEPPSGGT